MSETNNTSRIQIVASDAQNALGALVKLSENDMSVSLAVRVGRNITAMREYVKPLDEAVAKIFEEHKNKEGVITPNTTKHRSFVEKTKALYEETYEIEIHHVEISDLEEANIKVSPVVAAELIECGILVGDE